MSTTEQTIKNKVVNREEWLAARKALLEKEKELTRANDSLTAQRAALPMVKVDKSYTFKDENGSNVTLADLFQGKPQLIVYHFMFGPDEDAGCHGCSHIAEALPDVRHLRFKDTNLVCISRAPVEKLRAFKDANGWAWLWYSSQESDFNYDFHATIDESVCPVEMNFRTKEEMEAKGKRWWTGDVPGFSVFYRQGDEIFHTYSTWERGGDKIMPTLQLLDMTPLGRRLYKYGPAEFRLKYEYDEEV
ncbi:hypothetical protein VFPPC_14726 [Pochonia chlamydosporia 170]|uniref:DUF899-domain-containing protein n=1 Tax=Pochonia chlamydosporia 170 TaxID=1380566 RepID=A0A179F109_METCM|nr:hypothetical protein VFPPC_14726 [Pochonia chlamydosporia 170]OAQ59136.1 hypothetical protein VFPPC_14726 [Pochonia chlamydosporia 170]